MRTDSETDCLPGLSSIARFLLHPTNKILMRPNVSLLVTASLMTLVLVLVGLLRSTSQQATEAEPLPDALSLVTPLLQPSPSKPSPNAGASADSVDALLDRPIPTPGKRETLKRRFTIEQSLDRVQQINQVLTSARTSTVDVQVNRHAEAGKQASLPDASAKLSPRSSASNWASTVTGTLKQQDYEIKKLELALAQKQFKDGEIPQTALAQKQANYQKATREFKTFLNTIRTAD